MAVKHTKKLFIKALEKKFANESKIIGAKGAKLEGQTTACLLYTSDAADDLLCVDLGGRRLIKKKK